VVRLIFEALGASKLQTDRARLQNNLFNSFPKSKNPFLTKGIDANLSRYSMSGTHVVCQCHPVD